MAQVLLTDVTKVYPGDVKAVDRFNLDIRDGEFVVLVGPSGCGKSTTLRMVAGLEEITSGEIRIGDRVVNEVHPKDRDIAMVFQNYALYPHMTVYNNMAFGLKLRKVPRKEIDRKVRDTARILGIEPLLERKPKALSGGQRQRVALGRAIVREPKAFLFDEPLSNLDAKLRVETRAELKALHMRLGTTTIYVTHDQEEAMTLGDRVVVMSNGLIQHVGSPIEVYNRPANRFVAGFLGMPPMNFLNGVVEAGSGSAGADRLYFVEMLPDADSTSRRSENSAHAGPLPGFGNTGGSRRSDRGMVIPIPDRFSRSAREWIGRPLVMGIRPEGIASPEHYRDGAFPSAAPNTTTAATSAGAGGGVGAVRGYAEGSLAAGVPTTAAALGSREASPATAAVGDPGFGNRSEAGAGGLHELDVRVVEPLGDRMDVHLISPVGRRLVARMAVTPLRPGGHSAFRIDPRSIHLFEPGEFGPRLTED